MYKSINQSEFTAAFHNAGRGDQFSRAGLIALYDYLEMMEENLGESMELDVIALCCSYSEYDSIDEAMEDHGYGNREEFSSVTTVIDVPNSDAVIVEQF